jgi:hypothetical protein
MAIIAKKKAAIVLQVKKDKLKALKDSFNRKKNSKKPICLNKLKKKEL